MSADVLNTLVDHDLDDLAPNGQLEEGEEEVDINYEEEEDVPEIDGEGEQEEDVELPSIIPAHRASTFSTISSLSTASKDSMFSVLSATSESYALSHFSATSGADSDFFEDSDDCISSSPVSEKYSPKSASKASARLSQHLYRLFKPKSPRSISRAKSLGNPEAKDLLVVREKRSNSLPQQVKLLRPEPLLRPQGQSLRPVCYRRRPILSSDDDSKSATLRVVVFGADHVAGKVARAYSSLRRKESACPRLSRVFNLQFYFVPVKRDPAAGLGGLKSPSPLLPTGTLKGGALSNVSQMIHTLTENVFFARTKMRWLLLMMQDLQLSGAGESTNDIAHLLGMLDPWYERNTLSLLDLPANIVCKVQVYFYIQRLLTRLGFFCKCSC